MRFLRVGAPQVGTKIDLKVIKEADLGKKSRKITTSSPQKSNKGSLCILECNQGAPRRAGGGLPRGPGPHQGALS